MSRRFFIVKALVGQCIVAFIGYKTDREDAQPTDNRGENGFAQSRLP